MTKVYLDTPREHEELTDKVICLEIDRDSQSNVTIQLGPCERP